MGNLTECLCCHDHFKSEDMHACRKSVEQVCIGCSVILRAKRRTARLSAAKATLKERATQEHEKAQKLADKLMGKSKPVKKAKRPPPMFQQIDKIRHENEMIKLALGEAI